MKRIVSVMIIIGALGSVALTLYTGRRNESILLMLLFSVWVFAPFIAMYKLAVMSKKWVTPLRSCFYFVVIAVAIGSIVCYSGAWSPVNTPTAFRFLVVPLVIWALLTLMFIVSRSRPN